MGKLVDFYQRHLAESSDEVITAEREQTQRTKQTHELASDIAKFGSEFGKDLKVTTEDAVITVNDGVREVTIETIEPGPAYPASCFRVSSPSGGLAEYDEEHLFTFLIEWIENRPDAYST